MTILKASCLIIVNFILSVSFIVIFLSRAVAHALNVLSQLIRVHEKMREKERENRTKTITNDDEIYMHERMNVRFIYKTDSSHA